MTRALRQGYRWLRLAPLGAVAALFAALALSGAWRRLSFASLEANHAQLSGYVARHPVGSFFSFVALYGLIVAACAPGLFVLTLAGGFLFGPILGGVATLAALELGGLAMFLACRTAFGDWAARRAGPALARIEEGFSRHAFSYLLALRLMPVAPFFLVTLAAGVARTRTSSFLLATGLGAAPSSFVIAALGAGLGAVFARRETPSARLMLEPRLALPLMGLALLSLAPAALRLWRQHRGAGRA